MIGSRFEDQHDNNLFSKDTWSLFAPNLSLDGFEADPVACAEANAKIAEMKLDWRVEHHPVGLWSTPGRRTLYVTRVPNGSSILRPSRDFQTRIENTDWIDVVKEIEVDLTTLDLAHADRKYPLDYIQLDVQGGELDVLKGAVATLAKGTLALQVEVEFREMYEDQPLFGDIDVFLRSQGFSFFGMSQPKRDRRRGIPFYSMVFPGAPTWGNAIYLRDLVRTDRNQALQTPERLLTLACVADALSFVDFALEVFVDLTLRFGTNPEYNFADDLVDFFIQIANYTTDEITTIPMFHKLRYFMRKHQLNFGPATNSYRSTFVEYPQD